jgi:hypothetical protein
MNNTEKEVSSLHLNTMFDSFFFFFLKTVKSNSFALFSYTNVFSHVILLHIFVGLSFGKLKEKKVSNVYIAPMVLEKLSLCIFLLETLIL